MNQRQLQKVLSKAEAQCIETGGRLTEKRKRILEVLLQSKVPLSAYEVADVYNSSSEASMPAMSVYRILDFLESSQLVHKLDSANKYIACSHIACDHAHQVPQFLMCRKCHAVKEIAIAKSLIEELGEQVSAAGYHLLHPQLELQCVCEKCRKGGA